MATTHTDDCPWGFVDEDFVTENYENYICNLQNENLFPRSKFPMFRERDTLAAHNAYALIQPALLLISRIIIQCRESFGVDT
jgi:hypothetical protein